MANNLVTLAHKYDLNKHDVRGWAMSEKLDGVRAIFTGSQFLTRNSKVLHAPWRFLGPMSKLCLDVAGETVCLDGELYMGRSRFQECCGIVRRHDDEWLDIEYHVFDITGPVGWPWMRRFTVLKRIIDQGPNFIKVVEHEFVLDRKHVFEKHFAVTSKGGEGVMLRNPLAPYERKRTKNLLKVKSFMEEDTWIIDHVPGNGKHEGRLGAYVCTYAGKEFRVGTGLSDEDRESPLPIGTKITVAFFELTQDGVPRFPVFKGERIDA